jgi:hypothetical protein
MQPAEKLSFVSGHRFSDAAKRFEISRPFRGWASKIGFFRVC